jgi:hypothetical protein
MALIGILCAFLLIFAALWGLWVSIGIVLGYRHTAFWMRVLVSVVMGAAFIWLLYGLYDSDVRRILTLLDIGLIIATGDIIARVTCWIDVQSGLKPLRKTSRRRPRRSLAPPSCSGAPSWQV